MITIKNENGMILKHYGLYEQCCSACNCKDNYDVILGGFYGGDKFDLSNYHYIYDTNDGSLVAFRDDDGTWNNDPKYCFCETVNSQNLTLNDVIACSDFYGYIRFEGNGYNYNDFLELWDSIRESYPSLENRTVSLGTSDSYDYEVTIL